MCGSCYLLTIVAIMSLVVSGPLSLCLSPALGTPRPVFLVSGQQVVDVSSGSVHSSSHGRWRHQGAP